MPKFTEKELVAKMRAENLDVRDQADALIAKADAAETEHEALIVECGYDVADLMHKAYCV